MWGFESSIPSHLARSSSGPGHRPLKAKIAGSNPARATTLLTLPKAPSRSDGWEPDRSPFDSWTFGARQDPPGSHRPRRVADLSGHRRRIRRAPYLDQCRHARRHTLARSSVHAMNSIGRSHGSATVTWHTLRHTAATQWLRQGADAPREYVVHVRAVVMAK